MTRDLGEAHRIIWLGRIERGREDPIFSARLAFAAAVFEKDGDQFMRERHISGAQRRLGRPDQPLAANLFERPADMDHLVFDWHIAPLERESLAWP